MYVNHQIFVFHIPSLDIWPLNPNIFPEPTTSLFSLMLLAPQWLPFFCPFNVLNSKSQSPELNDSVLRCCSLLWAGMLLFCPTPKRKIHLNKSNSTLCLGLSCVSMKHPSIDVGIPIFCRMKRNFSLIMLSPTRSYLNLGARQHHQHLQLSLQVASQLLRLTKAHQPFWDKPQ